MKKTSSFRQFMWKTRFAQRLRSGQKSHKRRAIGIRKAFGWTRTGFVK